MSPITTNIKKVEKPEKPINNISRLNSLEIEGQ